METQKDKTCRRVICYASCQALCGRRTTGTTNMYVFRPKCDTYRQHVRFLLKQRHVPQPCTCNRHVSEHGGDLYESELSMKYRLRKSRTGMLRYEYCCREWGCSFTLLCEVGQPYQPWFRATIRDRGYVIETRELPKYPWVADFVVKERTT